MTLEELEKKVQELELRLSAKDNEVDTRKLWEQFKAQPNVDGLLDEFKAAMASRNAKYSRPQVHSLVDTIVSAGIVPFSITVTFSSEPCVTIVLTIITNTICDE